MSNAELPDIRWELTTHEGNRRDQLRRARQLTLRERLQALEGMAELSARFARMRERGGRPNPQPPSDRENPQLES